MWNLNKKINNNRETKLIEKEIWLGFTRGRGKRAGEWGGESEEGGQKGSSDGKGSSCRAGDLGVIPGLR